MTGVQDELVAESERCQRDVMSLTNQLADVSSELSESSNHVTVLEQTVEAERASHIQTKFTCELLQVYHFAR